MRPDSGSTVAADSKGTATERCLRAIDATAPPKPEPDAKPGIRLEYRNIAQVDVKVYPVDLMQPHLTRHALETDRRNRPGRDHAPDLRRRSRSVQVHNDYDDLSRIDRAPLDRRAKAHSW